MSAQQTDRFYGGTAGVAIKAPCVTHSTGNITALSGLLTVNSVLLEADDRVLVKDQTLPVDNGIYRAATGAWQRAADFDGNRDVVQGTLCTIEGATSATTWFKVTNTGTITIGTTALTFAQVAAPVATAISVGNLIYPRTEAEEEADIDAYDAANTIGDIMFPHYEPGDVRRYGALGAGTDDYAGIQAAFDQMAEDEADAAPVVFQMATYTCNTGLIWLGDYTTVYGNGAKLTTAVDIVGLTIGETPSGGVALRQAKLIGGLGWYNTGTSTKQAFLTLNTQECHFQFGEADGFHTCLELDDPDKANQWNRFDWSRFKNHVYGIYIPDTASFSINENWFHGTRIQMTSTVGQYNIYCGTGSGNTFEGIDTGVSGVARTEGMIYDNGGGGGDGNRYINLRCETKSGFTMVQKNFLLDKDSEGTLILNCYDIDASDVDNRGKENRLWLNDQLSIKGGHGGQRSQPFLDICEGEANSSGIALARFQDAYLGWKSSLIQTITSSATVDGSYHLDCLRSDTVADPVIVLGADDVSYECISAHLSAAGNEPGAATESASWATYWRRLNVNEAGGAWAAGTQYDAPLRVFRIQGDGEIWTNQLVADTSAPPANAAYKMAIFDEAGNPRGFIAVYATI